jgi:arylsulfatase A-like enzyme
MSGRPNVLLLYTDDQRFDTIHAWGCEAISTPNMDRLAARGVSFTHACIPGGTVGAVCMPSRAMLHTGRTLFHLADAGSHIPEDHYLMGEWFQDQGYCAFGTGKWHNGSDSYARSFTAGAEIFFGGMSDHWNVPACDFDPTGEYPEPTPFVRNPFGDNGVTHRQADHVTFGKHSSELFGEAASAFLEEYDWEQPLFMYVAFMAPHDPRTMPREFLDMYDPDEIELPPNFAPEHAFDNGALCIRDELLADFPRTEAEIRRHIAEYYAMISHLDAEIGKVLDTLERTGRAEETIVVLAGDNGLALGQHGLMGKQSNYEHSVRVPLMMAGPGIPEGTTNDGLVYLLDIYPTLCDLIGAPTPDSVEGTSLVSTMWDPESTARETLYFAYAEFMRSVTDGRFKLVEYVVDGVRITQLYDLEADPWEMRNLAGDPTLSALLSSLRQELVRYRDEWGDRDTPWGQTFWAEYEAG